MKPYSSYIDCELPWITSLPSHWTLSKLKYSLNEIIGGGTPDTSNPDFWDDEKGIPWVAISDITKQSYLTETSKKISEDGRASKGLQIIPRGTLLISIFASLGKTTLLGIDATVNQAILGLIPSAKLNRTYLSFFLSDIERYVSYYSSSNTQENLNLTKIRNLNITLPPLPEQQAIADFLDRKTAQIDTLIEKKQRQIDLLQEQRTALINHAVTKGLNPDVRMKNSGVEWLGEIPSHWGVARLSYLTERIGDGLHGTPEYVDTSDYHFINGNNLVKGEIQFFESTKCVSKDEFQKHDVGLNDKTILLSINGTIGNIAFYQGEKVMLGKSAAYIVFQDDLLKNYFFHYLQSTPIQNYFGLESTGTTIYNLSLKSIRSTPFPLPPDNEKKSVADYLNKQQLEFDKANNIIIRQIDTLKEYRTALISEAVTGKIDVRNLQ